jgi:hypothetical protein
MDQIGLGIPAGSDSAHCFSLTACRSIETIRDAFSD